MGELFLFLNLKNRKNAVKVITKNGGHFSSVIDGTKSPFFVIENQEDLEEVVKLMNLEIFSRRVIFIDYQQGKASAINSKKLQSIKEFKKKIRQNI